MSSHYKTTTPEVGERGSAVLQRNISELPYQQKRVIILLYKAKEPQSVADISKALGQADPRGHIRELRIKGYPIDDVWCKSKYKGRYKRYFIKK